ncbi:tetratricopeptide repeat protein [Nocardioides aurantiacus]|uniref:Tetratricopeptide repeat protein n=1 Tax=Nocardioides aurantiacus TaxID=86796 RepID=A0A3N2CTI0_9ACTN|nr:tetratricopeptide repeat protein [Nocardioides aurantiacus]ROR90756.1 tetratricopeptide repeat protein [Nocardioides aurantiacus]
MDHDQQHPTPDDHDATPELRVPALVFPGQLADPASAHRLAWDLLERRAPREALEVLDAALAQDEDNVGLRTLRAWAYLIQARLGHAEAELRWLVAADPSDEWARHALGRSLERQSRYADALPHLRLAAAMTGDPEHETAVLRVERRLAETGATSYDALR